MDRELLLACSKGAELGRLSAGRPGRRAPWEELQQWGPTKVSEGRAAEGHPWEKPELLQRHGHGAR
ncbi:hypothetical protein Zm00014a_002983 [Zea mays]|uniref:Uncharacterized protein n=1 Tax=Zea mays TaxID=4577 RepID=A0A3L6FBS8_MAIZE|nr:hypothetical protein Zm00014a_002983 [Zea mays]